MLFILGGLASLAVATRLWNTHDTVAWALGGVTAAGMAAGFLLSRSVGLPGFHPTDWEPSGILSVIVEAGFVAALAWRARVVARVPQFSRVRAG